LPLYKQPVLRLANPVGQKVEIPYRSNTVLLNNLGSRVAQLNFNANNLADKTGTILTNFVLWIQSYFARYGVYLVTSTSVEATFTNLEQFGVEIYYTPTLINPLSSLSYDAAINACMSPGYKSIVLPEQYGKGQHTITKTIYWPKYYANEDAYLGSELFSGNANSAPVNINYHNITILAPTNLTAGVNMVFKEIDHVCFYLNVPATATSFETQPHFNQVALRHFQSRDEDVRPKPIEKSCLFQLSKEQLIDMVGKLSSN
jgi:hypothetical protein